MDCCQIKCSNCTESIWWCPAHSSIITEKCLALMSQQTFLKLVFQMKMSLIYWKVLFAAKEKVQNSYTTIIFESLLKININSNLLWLIWNFPLWHHHHSMSTHSPSGTNKIPQMKLPQKRVASLGQKIHWIVFPFA